METQNTRLEERVREFGGLLSPEYRPYRPRRRHPAEMGTGERYAQDLMDTTAGLVREHPIPMLVGAAIAGFALGMAWKAVADRI